MQNIAAGSIVRLRSGVTRAPLCKPGRVGDHDWFHWMHQDLCKDDIGLVLQIIRHPVDQRFWAQIQVKELTGWLKSESLVSLS